MKSYLSLLTTFLSLIVLELGCQQPHQVNDSQLTSHLNNPQPSNDTLPAKTIEVPINSRGDTLRIYQTMRKIEERLGLDRLVNGYDSLQIRILLTLRGTPLNHMLIIANRNSKWQSELIDLRDGGLYDTTYSYEVISNKFVRPRSGWTNFIKSLHDLGIKDLPDYTLVPDASLDTHESLAVIEYTTAEYYKLISYPIRRARPNISSQEVQVEKIIQYLEKELDFTRHKRPKTKQP